MSDSDTAIKTKIRDTLQSRYHELANEEMISFVTNLMIEKRTEWEPKLSAGEPLENMVFNYVCQGAESGNQNKNVFMWTTIAIAVAAGLAGTGIYLSRKKGTKRLRSNI